MCDVAQEAFVKLCSVERSEQPPAQWLFTVCRNLSIDVVRKSAGRFLAEGQAERYESSMLSPHERAEQDDSVSLILRSMADLPHAAGGHST